MNSYQGHMSVNSERSTMRSSQSTLFSTSGSNCIGFSELPNVLNKKHARRGYPFTIGVVGESGLGKSTLIESLFMVDLYDYDEEEKYKLVNNRMFRDVQISPIQVEIEEASVRVKLTVIDLPGYGDKLNGENQFTALQNFITHQFSKYYTDETGLNRRNMEDHRMHCLLYFVNPTGRGLKPLDISFIKHFHKQVNIIPIIAKADMLTRNELVNMKHKIKQQIKDYELCVYSGPNREAEDYGEPEEARMQAEFSERFPYAVIGSTQEYQVGDVTIRGRQYPWGVIDINDSRHSDFSTLRKLIVNYMLDMSEATHELHYENYRQERMFSEQQSVNQPQNLSPFNASVNRAADGNFSRASNVTESEVMLEEKENEIARLKAQLDAMKMQQQQLSRQGGRDHVVV